MSRHIISAATEFKNTVDDSDNLSTTSPAEGSDDVYFIIWEVEHKKSSISHFICLD